METTVGICLAFEDLYSDAGRGDLISTDGVVLRLKAVIKKMNQIGAKRDLLVSTAGYSKRDPRHPQPEREVSLSRQLYRYIGEKMPVAKYSFYIFVPLCWSTENEIRVGIEEAMKTGYCHTKEKANLVIASHPFHLVRVWMYCKMYMPIEWRLHLVPVVHKFSYKSYLHEFYTLFRDLPRFFKSIPKIPQYS